MSASFAAWVAAVFDHPVGGPEWYWGESFADEWGALEVTDRLTVKYLTRLFREPAVLARFSLDQVAQGIWFLVGDASPAQPSRALVEQGVPLAERIECVRTMIDFFGDFVAPAAPGPADTDRNAFHIACYMWWDIFPSWGGPRAGEPALHVACLEVMADVLWLRSELCQLSALHGLNHWHPHHAGAVERIVDAFLDRASDVTTRVREYALLARRGAAL